MGLPANVLRRNNEYVLCWQQQQEFNEEVEDEVRTCERISQYAKIHLQHELSIELGKIMGHRMRELHDP